MRADERTPKGTIGWVFLDGVWQPACYGFDDVEGWVYRAVEAPDSRPHEGAFRGVIENGAYKYEKVHGKVQFTLGGIRVVPPEVLSAPGLVTDPAEIERLTSQIGKRK